MNRRHLAYWIATGLFCLAMLPGAVMDLMGAEPVMQVLGHLGYPHYVARILGLWKILGVIALLAPGKPRLKEWAYAGFVFDLTGAMISHMYVGDGVGEYYMPIVLMIVLAVSYLQRPESRR